MSAPRGRPIVDVHHHFIPRNVFDRLVEQAGGQRRLVTDEISITLNPDLADLKSHLAAMDHAGVTTAVLSNAGLNFMGMEICRAINDGMAEVMRQHPGRLIGTAHLPPEPAAADELERCVKELKLPAIALPTSTGDVNLDDPVMDPIWAQAERSATPIILHPNLLPRGAETDYGMERSIARPTDTTKAAVRIMQNVFDRFPNLIFILPHCGGTLAFLKGRIAMFFDHPSIQRPPELRGYGLTANQQRAFGFDKLYEERFRRFYVDTAGTAAWPQAIKTTSEVFKPDRMLMGSDYPLEAKTPEEMAEVISSVYQIGLSEAELEQIESGNARRLFRLGQGA